LNKWLKAMDSQPTNQIKLKLFNSLEGKISELILQPHQTVNLYLCGPTVYGPVHIGNLRPVILFDILHRTLLSLKIKVNYVHNITDIDDKIIAQSQKEGSRPTIQLNKENKHDFVL